MKRNPAWIVTLCAATGLLWMTAARAADETPAATNATPAIKAPESPRPESVRAKNRMDGWLEQLKEKDPAEYSRLSALRASDPSAFRQEIRAKMEEKRMVLGGGDPARMGPRRGLGAPGERNPQMMAFEMSPEMVAARQKILALKDAYDKAPDQAAKDTAAAQIKEQIAKMFDLQQNFLQSNLKSMEQKLQERAAQRDQTIDQRVQGILSGKGSRPANREPPPPQPPAPAE